MLRIIVSTPGQPSFRELSLPLPLPLSHDIWIRSVLVPGAGALIPYSTVCGRLVLMRPCFPQSFDQTSTSTSSYLLSFSSLLYPVPIVRVYPSNSISAGLLPLDQRLLYSPLLHLIHLIPRWESYSYFRTPRLVPHSFQKISAPHDKTSLVITSRHCCC